MKVTLTSALALALLAWGCGKKDAPAGAEPAAPVAEGDTAEARAEGPRPTPSAPARPAEAGELTSPSTNAPNAKVEIVYWSDFQCPFCSRVNPVLEEVKRAYGEQVKLTFRHNALSFHKEARPAAIAAMAAHRQGRFWEYHDLLFANQRALKPHDLERYATELGLDLERFKEDLASAEIAAFVDRDQAIAVALGATGTPASFVNGRSLPGAQPLEQFKAVIDAEIAEANQADQRGAEWIASRTRVHNPALHAFLFEDKAPPAIPSQPQPRVDRTVYRVDVDPERDAITGGVDTALVTLVVFSEFECPFCEKLRPALARVVDEYGDDVRLVFKHNPLPFHRRAVPAALASLCAKDQGRFWEMHDRLFENMRALQDADLERYGEELGLDVEAYRSCLEDRRHEAQILEDQDLAGKVTARGTPNTFINGRKLTGAKAFEELKALVDEEIPKARTLATERELRGQALYEEIVRDGRIFEPLESRVHEFDLAESPRDGELDAKIQIVEFSDFQCPFCARISAPLREVKRHYGDDVVIVFKHFPLSFNKDSKPAAAASMCANAQGRFWEYHDVLFANMRALGADELREYAAQVELDLERFDACVAAREHEGRVEADVAEARAAGVRGTPTLFINGRRFNPPSGYNLQAFTSVIDRYLLNR